jgi:hypothetical protein
MTVQPLDDANLPPSLASVAAEARLAADVTPVDNVPSIQAQTRAATAIQVRCLSSWSKSRPTRR